MGMSRWPEIVRVEVRLVEAEDSDSVVSVPVVEVEDELEADEVPEVDSVPVVEVSDSEVVAVRSVPVWVVEVDADSVDEAEDSSAVVSVPVVVVDAVELTESVPE